MPPDRGSGISAGTKALKAMSLMSALTDAFPLSMFILDAVLSATKLISNTSPSALPSILNSIPSKDDEARKPPPAFNSAKISSGVPLKLTVWNASLIKPRIVAEAVRSTSSAGATIVISKAISPKD